MIHSALSALPVYRYSRSMREVTGIACAALAALVLFAGPAEAQRRRRGQEDSDWKLRGQEDSGLRGQEDSGFGARKPAAAELPALAGLREHIDRLEKTPDPKARVVLAPAALPQALFGRVLEHVRDQCDFQGEREEVGDLCCMSGVSVLAPTGRRVTACMDLQDADEPGPARKAIYRESTTAFMMSVQDPAGPKGERSATFFKLTPGGTLEYAQRETLGPKDESLVLSPTPELVEYWKAVAGELLHVARPTPL